MVWFIASVSIWRASSKSSKLLKSTMMAGAISSATSTINTKLSHILTTWKSKWMLYSFHRKISSIPKFSFISNRWGKVFYQRSLQLAPTYTQLSWNPFKDNSIMNKAKIINTYKLKTMTSIYSKGLSICLF